MLLLGASALGLLQYLPDAYDAVSEWLSPSQDLPTPPEWMSQEQAAALGGQNPVGSGAFQAGSAIPEGTSLMLRSGDVIQAPAGATMGIDGILEYPGGGFDQLSPWQGLGSDGLPPAPTEGAGLGPVDINPVEAGTNALEGGTNATEAAQGGWLNNPLGLSDALFTTPDLGLGSVGGVSLDAAALNIPAAIFGYGVQGLAKPGGELGAGIGSTLGGIAGSIIGGPWGAALGTIAGGAIGGQIGPAPTIGRNFGSMATIGGDGNYYWSNAGGDNGGSASDANAFTDWFGQALRQQAAQQGLVFNPNMAGAQFNIGGYDNFWRGGQTAGGFFYDPYLSGSPESSALRPADDWMSGGYSADQANAFTTNVLADLTARGVYTQPGAEQRGLDYWASTSGADLGFYGAPGGAYSDVAQGGGDWNSLLSGRQNAINGFLDQQRQNAAREAARMNTVLSQGEGGTQYGAIDPTMPMFFNDAIGLAGDFGLSTQPMQPNAPFVYDPGGA